VTSSLGPEPSYCKIHLGGPLTPSQWMTCWKYGWNEPTTLMARIGHDFGHDVLPVLIILAVMVFVVIRSLIRI
jgi:hypothetical protein